MIFKPPSAPLLFWSFLEGKTAPKSQIFKIGLKPKSGLGFFVSEPEVPFFGTWKRALLAKVPVFKRQKIALRVPKQKNKDHFSMPTSPQNGVEHVCFMRLALLGGF